MPDARQIEQIRVRASVAVVENGKILLVPHFYPNREVEWFLAGGGVHFGENLKDAASREFLEETGYLVKLGEMLHLDEVIEPATPYHGIGVVFAGQIVGGEKKPEFHPVHGLKEPQWFAKEELQGKIYKPKGLIDILLGTP